VLPRTQSVASATGNTSHFGRCVVSTLVCEPERFGLRPISGQRHRPSVARHFCCWHFSDMPRQPDDVRSPGQSRHPAARPRLPFLTHLYGPAVRCKPNVKERVGLAHLYPALAWSVCAPGHHGYPRAPDLILRKALRGRLGHQITGATARPFLHFLHPTRRPRQVSVA
jgi:hypothetical protein